MTFCKTDGKQVPWENSSLTGQFYFKPGAAQAGTPTTADEIAALREEIERLKSGQAPQAQAKPTARSPSRQPGHASSETQVAAADESATPETAEAATPTLPPEPTPEALAPTSPPSWTRSNATRARRRTRGTIKQETRLSVSTHSPSSICRSMSRKARPLQR
ncbi:MAG: hypothetical protein R3D01_09405 [Hyphomicrobiales bacterium]